MTRIELLNTPKTTQHGFRIAPFLVRRPAISTGASLILFLTLAGSLTTDALAETTSPAEAVNVVTQLHSGLVDASNDFADATMEKRYAALEPLIKETHDLPFIARFAMRRYWADLTEQQRGEFLDTFTRLSIATYASRFQNLNEETFGISGQTDRPRGHVEINGTLVQKDGEALGINYILHQTDSGWRIINIIVDGVSDLALKRAEFQRVYLDVEFSGLVDYLSRQVDQLMPASPANPE
jgi:phospholipid transport system substrate-binding protein